jgi:hypothetical protein
MASKWVLVDAVSMFRMRYMVEVPEDHPEYALDTVTMHEAKEFSQEHLDEIITSHRVVTLDEALQICDQDNSYLKTWSKQDKIDNLFTSMEDQGYDTTEHSQYYFEFDRNK